jgi:hypothetical protein
MNVTFDSVRDDMPYQFFGAEERKKLIHTMGVAAQINFRITNHSMNYTGLFASGCQNAIIRFSLAKAAGTASCTEGCLAPGISVKLLRSQVPSATFLGLYSLLGQDSWNFFAHDFSSQPPDFGSWAGTGPLLLRAKFEESSQFPTMLGLSTVAQYDESGNSVAQPKFPFRVIYHPTTKLHKALSDKYTGVPFQKQLMTTLTPGEVIYEVYGQDSPFGSIGKIGEFVLTGQATTSHFGDRTYFLQHTRWENDAVFRPDWLDGAKAVQKQQRSAPAPGYHYPDLPWN